MIIDYIEVALLLWWHNYLDKKILIKFEKKYENYKKNWEWELLENTFKDFFEWLNINETMNFIYTLKIKILNLKLEEKIIYNNLIMWVIFSFLFSAFIYDYFDKYKLNQELKEYLFNILNDVEKWKYWNNYSLEKITFYKHNVYRLFLWLSNEEYLELCKNKFWNNNYYEWLNKWYWEF